MVARWQKQTSSINSPHPGRYFAKLMAVEALLSPGNATERRCPGNAQPRCWHLAPTPPPRWCLDGGAQGLLANWLTKLWAQARDLYRTSQRSYLRHPQILCQFCQERRTVCSSQKNQVQQGGPTWKEVRMHELWSREADRWSHHSTTESKLECMVWEG